MAYQVILPRPAKKLLDELPTAARNRVALAIADLAHDPRPRGCRKLAGVDAWRLRVGDYRVIYRIDDARQVVVVAWVGPRKDAYRGN